MERHAPKHTPFRFTYAQASLTFLVLTALLCLRAEDAQPQAQQPQPQAAGSGSAGFKEGVKAGDVVDAAQPG